MFHTTRARLRNNIFDLDDSTVEQSRVLEPKINRAPLCCSDRPRGFVMPWCRAVLEGRKPRIAGQGKSAPPGSLEGRGTALVQADMDRGFQGSLALRRVSDSNATVGAYSVGMPLGVPGHTVLNRLGSGVSRGDARAVRAKES